MWESTYIDQQEQEDGDDSDICSPCLLVSKDITQRPDRQTPVVEKLGLYSLAILYTVARRRQLIRVVTKRAGGKDVSDGWSDVVHGI